MALIGEMNYLEIGGNTYSIPSGNSVSITRNLTSGTKSATINVDGTDYDIYSTTPPVAATATPLMDGTAAIGSSAKYAKEDHVHPSDTSKFSKLSYENGTTEVGVRPLVDFARANRLAFLPADQIIIEQTIDGGTTWTSGGYSDTAKQALFAIRGGNILIPRINGEKSTLCGVRITITGMKYNVPDNTAETDKYNYWNSSYIKSAERYSNLREMWFWISSNNDAMRIQIQKATGANSTTWSNVFDNDAFRATGWSGSDWVRFSSYVFGGGTTQTSNYWNWRIIFWSQYAAGKTAFQSTTQQVIQGINAYGDSVWTSSNGLMLNDHLYTWDVNKNVTFPAKVTATSFAGSLTGNVTGNCSGNAATATNAPTQASINSSGLITYKNSSGTSLFTLQLPLYNGGVS